eukprot:TRINITY_DN106556_c0_g1_i1.p1 TRINITY_DN106556_c0_g1~~TRINITY_DN106556_c0_g1_i1.p1  ORF type:complete len:396 (+),score=84.04 TRINITY_DN106556_c0_g1_i1:47-1234(+)
MTIRDKLALINNYEAPAKRVGLRHFPCEPSTGSEGSMSWRQTMGSMTLQCELGESNISQEDVSVKLSSCQLQVQVKGKAFAIMTGYLQGTVLPHMSWWMLHRQAAKRRTMGVDAVVERFTIIVELAKAKHRAWPTLWHTHEMKHKAASIGYAWTMPMEEAQDFNERTQLQDLSLGPPIRSRSLALDDDAPKKATFLFSPDDMVIGLRTSQDNRSLTIEVHFEGEALAVVQNIIPLEEILAADIFEDRVAIFLRGDEQNPILWATLNGRCLPKESTWKLITSDAFRSRQRNPAAPGVALQIVVAKQKTNYGQWSKLFSSCLQHQLMLKNYDELEELLESLKGDEIDSVRLSPAERADYQRRLAEWKEDRYEGLAGAQTLPRTAEVGFSMQRPQLAA